MSFSKLITLLSKKNLGLAICITLISTSIYAQKGIISPGDAVVTGFSGTVDPVTNTTLFDNNGPSLRVITLPGSGAFGFRNTLKPYTAPSSSIGQVFGIALDDASEPNIYVAATSAYGLAIYKPKGGRLKHGAPGAQFMPGQFGPDDQGGGPGSIWRIDGKSGKVTLFANLIYNGIENTPAALGGLAFDPTTRQLFVADRTTGMIHRFTLDGTDQGVFDHGVQGLTMIGQPPVPFDPATLANISNVHFDTEKPNTWGFAPAPRRVFALAVHGQRLYYSVYGPQIWSVGIAADGSFVDDVRFEVESPALQEGIEISSIAFDTQGSMYIAERGAPTGDYNFINVANSGQSRVKRFTPKMPTDSSPDFWVAPGDEYAIGMPTDYQNADGGVTLTCGRTLWATGDRLLDTGNLQSDLHLDGLQGNDKDLVRPANAPPQQSWFVNYYDNQADPNSRGHMGALVNRSICSGYTAPVVPAGFTCPAGTYLIDGFCFIPPACPGGTVFLDGYCVYPNCPWGFVRINDACIPPPIICDYGTVFINGYCVPVGCPPGLDWAPYGYCHCPDYSYYHNGRCTPPIPCPPGERYRDGRCIPSNPCPPHHTYHHGRCTPNTPCPPEQTYRHGRCTPNTPCPPNQMYRNGRCTPTIICPPNQTYREGRCLPNSQCPPNQTYRHGRCTPNTPCPPNQLYRDGRCTPNTECQPNQTYRHGRCTPNTPCPPNQLYRDGRCTPNTECPPNQIYKHGRCTPNTPCPANQTYRDGLCIPNKLCPGNQTYRDGRCVPNKLCPGNQTYRDGRCIPNKLCPGNQTYRDGRCVPNKLCPGNQTYRDGRCVPNKLCPGNQTYRDGRCIPNKLCPGNQTYRDGRCVPNKLCPGNQVYRHGRCVPNKLCPGNQVYRHGRCTPITQSTPHCGPHQVYRGGRCIMIDPGKNPNQEPNKRPSPGHYYPKPHNIPPQGETPLRPRPGYHQPKQNYETPPGMQKPRFDQHQNYPKQMRPPGSIQQEYPQTKPKYPGQ